MRKQYRVVIKKTFDGRTLMYLYDTKTGLALIVPTKADV